MGKGRERESDGRFTHGGTERGTAATGEPTKEGRGMREEALEGGRVDGAGGVVEGGSGEEAGDGGEEGGGGGGSVGGVVGEIEGS